MALNHQITTISVIPSSDWNDVINDPDVVDGTIIMPEDDAKILVRASGQWHILLEE